MLKKPNFWAEEKDAPLFNLNNGFIEREGDKLFERAQRWVDYVGNQKQEAEYVLSDDLEIPRIVTADAERTLIKDENRLELAKFLAFLNNKFGDYAQGLGYVASVVYLFLKPEQAYGMLSRVNSDPKYIPGYWKHSAVGFATDAYVFEHFLEKELPDVAAHLRTNSMLPEMYCQKWFVGLCLHVLPFENLFDYLDQFFQYGATFLYRFAISLMRTLGDKILSTNDPVKLFGYLRLDPKFVDVDFAEIIKGADDFNVETDIEKIETLRRELYEKHLKARMENVPPEDDSDDEIVFSDEE